MKTGLLFTLLLLASVPATAQQRYTITGTIPCDSCDGSYAVLQKESLPFIDRGNFTVDSVKISRGHFRFRGKTADPFMANLRISSPCFRNRPTPLIVEPGKIRVEYPALDTSGCVSGTPINEEYYREIRNPELDYFRETAPLITERTAAIEAGTWTTDDEGRFIHSLPYESWKALKEKTHRFIEKYARYGAVVEGLLYPEMLSGDTVPILDALSKLPEESRSRLYRLKAESDRLLDSISRNHKPRGFKEVLHEGIREGDSYTDFSGETQDGGRVSLSEILPGKKLVLIDFWASWCVPCRRETPVIAEIYAKYKDKGLEVVGVSSDKDAESWKAAIEKEGMEWLQLRGNEGGKIYNVQTIPFTLLIDGSGKIVSRRLRGEELKARIDSLMAE